MYETQLQRTGHAALRAPGRWRRGALQPAAHALCAAALLAGSGTGWAGAGPRPSAHAASDAAGPHAVAVWSVPATPQAKPQDPVAAGEPGLHAARLQVAHETAWHRWSLRLAALGVGAGVGWLLLRLGRGNAGQEP